MRFLQNHKDNYGASCKPENGMKQMQQIFYQLQKAPLLRIFQAFSQKSDIFPGCITFFSLRNQKFI